jgi:hypothetical protein
MSMRLIDLFSLPDVAALLAGFPRRIQPGPGLEANFGEPELLTWLGFLNGAVAVNDVRAGSGEDGVSVEARLSGTMAAGSFPEGFPFFFGSMPDVAFRIQDMPADKPARLFARAGADGGEVVIEDLLVEIGLPEGLVTPPDPTAGNAPEVAVTYGIIGDEPDALQVVLRRSGRSTMRLRVRIHMDSDGEATLRFAVPVSFGPCSFSGLPCRAVHDFRLIPSPSRAAEEIEWLRHDVVPFDAGSQPINGSFAIRALDLDPEAPALADAAKALNDEPDNDPTAVLVIEDLVVPFYQVWAVPIPRHITVGVRRDRVAPYDIREEFAFDRAPVKARLARSPDIQLILDSFFFRSMPLEELDRDLGLTFKAGLVFGDGAAPPAGTDEAIDHHTLLIELGDNYTVRVGYRRAFDDTTGLPEPTTGAGRFIDQLLSTRIENVAIDIMAIRVGYAIGKAVSDGASFGDCFECTVDLWITTEPSDGGVVQFKALSGGNATFGITDLGWKQGSLSVESVKAPDGVEILIADVFSVFLEELGLVVREGATFFTISGGLGVQVSGSFEIKAGVRGLAIRIAGNPAARSPQIEGFYLILRVPNVIELDAAGYYVQKKEEAFDISELGLSAKARIFLQATTFTAGFDLIVGNAKSPAESFDYFFIQLFAKVTIPLVFLELRGARALFGRNMQPKLPSPAKDELRYFKWYKTSDPIKVDANRRLSAWEPQNEVWSGGVGVSASFPGCGAVAELGLFVLVVDGPDESGLLIVGELFLLGNDTAAGTLVIEWDGKEERFSFMVGVSIKASEFVDGAPDWLGQLVSVTGTLFASNKRAIVAVGRLADQATWFRLVVDIDFLLGRSYLEIAAAFEYSEGPDGARGFGLIVRFNGGLNAGIIRLEYNLGLGIVVASFNNSSSDFAVAFWIEGGLRFVLFGFIRFGISARAEFRVVGANPSRGEISFRITLETPWFLPDVTWTFQHAFGELEPERLATATGALRGAGSRKPLTDETKAVYSERLDPNWDANTPPSTTSIAAIRARTISEATRIANFRAADLEPIATDSALAIDFTGTITDMLALGPSDVGADQGRQTSGDLTLVTSLVGIGIRRRSRFGGSGAWTPIEERSELVADFSDPSGVTLTGNIDPQAIQMSWDTDVRVDSVGAAKRLLINARTPFDFATVNPEVDEEIVATNPRWPCCPPRQDQEGRTGHVIAFAAEPLGTRLATPPALSRLFTDSRAPLHLPRPTVVRDARGLASGTPPRVGAVTVARQGLVFACDFDRDAISFRLSGFWTGPGAVLVLRAVDAADQTVGEAKFNLQATGLWQQFELAVSRPMRRLTATVVGGNLSDDRPLADPDIKGASRFAALELARLTFVALEDWVREATGAEGCREGEDAFFRQYEGRGSVFWLPNHEYEVTIRTRVAISHPQTDEQAADLEEHVYFATKGLPGLNAVEETGAELRPYVRSAYNGGRGALYREEPITLAFHEDYSIAVPLASRPAGATGDEATQLFPMRLVAEPQAAIGGGGTSGTATAADWIVVHRTGITAPYAEAFRFLVGAAETVASRFVSENARILRLAGLTQRPAATCALADPREVVGPVLIAHPEGATDPADSTRKLWPPRTPIRAAVRREAAPFVHRERFVPIDATAFEFRTDANAAAAAWLVVDGGIGPASLPSHALFGDADWLHVTVTLGFAVVSGQRAGIGFGLPASGVGAGIFAIVDRTGAADRLLLLRRGAAGGFSELSARELPDAAGPRVLVVNAYDDRVRAQIGEVAVEADRGESREGRLSLFAGPGCRFSDIDVRGLTLFECGATPGRYMSFVDHLGSWDGSLPRLHPDDMGAATTTTTVAALLAATRSEIAAVMAPTAEPVAREALFTRWSTGLGLALRARAEATRLAAFDEAGAAALLVIESDEPLDFTEEIKLTLARITFRAVRPALGGSIGGAVGVIGRPRAVIAPPGVAGAASRLDLRRPEMFIAATAGIDAAAARVEHSAELVSVLADGRAEVRDPATGRTRSVAGLPGDLRPGDRLVLDRDDRFTGIRLERIATDVPILVLQNGAANTALVLPLDAAGNAAVLAAGDYTLKARLVRRRWQTTGPADALNTYERETTLSLRL